MMNVFCNVILTIYRYLKVGFFALGKSHGNLCGKTKM